MVGEMQSAPEIITKERQLNSLSLLTVIVVLATVTMTFGAMVTVFVIRSQAPLFWGPLKIPGILWFTTGVLVASSATFETARRKLAHNDQHRFFFLTAWTAGLGLVFLAGQITAWFQILQSGIVLARNPHTWFIFLFSGLHGLHIVLGLAGLGYLLVRTWTPASGPKYQMKTRVIANGVSVFWHYLDFVWVVLFALLLTWRR
jgi:cytochrome c oxidase subunit III